MARGDKNKTRQAGKRRKDRRGGIERRGRSRGNTHLPGGAEGAKEKGDGRAGATPNEITLPG